MQSRQRVYPTFEMKDLFQYTQLIYQTTYYEISNRNIKGHEYEKNAPNDDNSSRCWAKEVYFIDLNGRKNLLWCNRNQEKLGILSYNDGRFYIKVNSNINAIFSPLELIFRGV